MYVRTVFVRSEESYLHTFIVHAHFLTDGAALTRWLGTRVCPSFQHGTGSGACLGEGSGVGDVRVPLGRRETCRERGGRGDWAARVKRAGMGRRRGLGRAVETRSRAWSCYLGRWVDSWLAGRGQRGGRATVHY